MIVSKIVLRNFRNYEYLTLTFDKHLNVIVGDNGVGKTNIVESIQFLSLARSFRSQETSDLILEGTQYSAIEAKVIENTTTKDIVAILTPNSKKITCNGKLIKKISELSSLVDVVVFEPKDTTMFTGSPLPRRNFFDIVISKKYPVYLEALMEFEKLLKERNKILKEEEFDKVQLDVVTNRLIEASKIIVEYRTSYVDEVNKILSKIVTAIKGENEKLTIEYKPFVHPGEDFASNCWKNYQDTLESDVKRKATTTGIHREDYTMYLNDKDISVFGSQGENRIAAIALKLTPYFLIEEKGKRPIIVLDDVMSELDNIHKGRLIEFLRKFEQVFITSTSTNVKDASIYEVSKNKKITRRNS